MLLTIDGSYGEGGGQILRSSLTLSALAGKPVRLINVRAGRSKPGLRPQHVTAIRALATISGATVEGDALGSQTLTFQPGEKARPGDYTFDVADAAPGGSAGSVTLILQSILLPLALASGPSRVTLRGGTNVPGSPPDLYIEQVYLPMMGKMGVRAEIAVRRRGFYPRGGGELIVQIPGDASLQPLDLMEPGALQKVRGDAFVSDLPSHIPQRMTNRARGLLNQQ
ncbi:MAG: RNA 3'-terminal phosphate cyclase, partial [Anaerolineae bacterium]